MEIINPYLSVIAICVILIISYNFNLISKLTSIPSVLLLIGLGIVIKQGSILFQIEIGQNINHILEMVGIVGLIMIVLEATIELELKKEKTVLILKSFFIALIALIFTSFAISYTIFYYIIPDFYIAMLYGVPLSIMSSAIIIPSISGLSKSKQEFLIYESAFSDILGIMFFYFLLDHAETPTIGGIVLNVTLNIIGTIVLAVVVSYFLVWLLQRINSQVKMVLLISVLIMLYSISKMLHLSSLLIILIFGIVLSNHQVFFQGRFKSWIDVKKLRPVLRDFHMITMESAFFVRTFFFVIFGVSLTLSDLLNTYDAIISIEIISAIVIIRFICLKLFRLKDIFPELFVAPRGMITILLFFSIPATYDYIGFSPGILLYTIIFSSILMALALVIKGKEKNRFEVLNFDDWDELDGEIKKLSGKKDES